VVGLLLLAEPTQAGRVVDRVAAVVGDRIIMLSEVQERTALFLHQSTEKDPLVRARSETKVLHDTCEAMVDDVLVEAEATSLHVDATAAEVDAGIAAVAKNNGVTVPRLFEMLHEQGFDERAYRGAVRSQLLAGKLLQLRGSAKPDEALEKLHAELRARVYVEVRIGS
jgi:peptidyl-prolyl cis-trans isomerase SurA